VVKGGNTPRVVDPLDSLMIVSSECTSSIPGARPAECRTFSLIGFRRNPKPYSNVVHCIKVVLISGPDFCNAFGMRANYEIKWVG
jgi:hypothetical protein